MMAKSKEIQLKSYLCANCDDSFDRKSDCMFHYRNIHLGQPPTFLKKNESSSSGGNVPKSTTTVKDSRKEDTQLTPSTASLRSFSDEEILAVLLERNSAFACKCGIIFTDKAMYYLHRLTHSDKNPYKCSFCGHVAPDWFDFMSHFYIH